MLKTMQQNQVLTDKLYKKGEMLFICARCHTGATVFSAVREEEGVRRHKTILQKMIAQKNNTVMCLSRKNADPIHNAVGKSLSENDKIRLKQKQPTSVKQTEAENEDE